MIGLAYTSRHLEEPPSKQQYNDSPLKTDEDPLACDRRLATNSYRNVICFGEASDESNGHRKKEDEVEMIRGGCVIW